MADREVVLAEQQAWNDELNQEVVVLRDTLTRGEADRENLARQISEADDRTKRLSAECARLQGVLERCQHQLGMLQGAASSSGAPHPGLRAELEVRDSRIEDLEAVLGALRIERQSLRQQNLQQGEEVAQLRGRLDAVPDQGMAAGALSEARERLSALETLCQGEQSRLGDLAADLRQVMRQAQVLGDTLAEERAVSKQILEENSLLEARAGHAAELELELETLRSRASSGVASRETLAQLTLLQQQVEIQRQAMEQARERVRTLNNVIGDREAEVLLLNAQLERLQRQAAQLLGEVRQALREPVVPPEELRNLLDRLGGGLEQLV